MDPQKTGWDTRYGHISGIDILQKPCIGIKGVHPSSYYLQCCCKSFKMKMLLLMFSYKIMKWTVNFSLAVGDPGFIFITFTEAIIFDKVTAEARQKIGHYLKG